MNDEMMDSGAVPPVPEAAPTEGTVAASEQCVPVAALAVADDGDQLANPEVGDQVNYQVAGKVTRIEGDQAYVTPETVNGQAVGKGPEAPVPSPEGELAGIEADAGQMGYLG